MTNLVFLLNFRSFGLIFWSIIIGYLIRHQLLFYTSIVHFNGSPDLEAFFEVPCSGRRPCLAALRRSSASCTLGSTTAKTVCTLEHKSRRKTSDNHSINYLTEYPQVYHVINPLNLPTARHYMNSFYLLNYSLTYLLSSRVMMLDSTYLSMVTTRRVIA